MAREDILRLAEPETEYAELLQNGTAPPKNYDINFWKTVTAARRPTVIQAVGPPPAGVTEHDHQVKMRDGASILVRSYSPVTAPKDGSPLIVIFHGGGFCIGELESETPNCRNLVLEFGAVALNVEYRLAPEFKFPTPINDSWDVVKWAAANANTLKANPSQGFIVGGPSAGGNIAAVCAHLARNEKLNPPLTGQILSNPILISNGRVPEKYKDQYLSWEQNSADKYTSVDMMDMFTKSYNPDFSSPLYDTLNDPSGHANLPPAYLQASGGDMLRDDAIIYERILREDYKVPTRINVYKGLPHMFWGFFPTSKAAIQWKEDLSDAVKWLLQKK